jgi:hypothetical protein
VRLARPDPVVIKMHSPPEAGGVCRLNDLDFDAFVFDGRHSRAGLTRVINRSPLQSSMLSRSTRRLAFSMASASSAQTNGSKHVEMSVAPDGVGPVLCHPIVPTVGWYPRKLFEELGMYQKIHKTI